MNGVSPLVDVANMFCSTGKVTDTVQDASDRDMVVMPHSEPSRLKFSVTEIFAMERVMRRGEQNHHLKNRDETIPRNTGALPSMQAFMGSSHGQGGRKRGPQGALRRIEIGKSVKVITAKVLTRNSGGNLDSLIHRIDQITRSEQRYTLS